MSKIRIILFSALLTVFMSVNVSAAVDRNEIQAQIDGNNQKIAEIKEVKDQLHTMANLFRYYLYLDSGFSDVLSQKWSDIHEIELGIMKENTELEQKIAVNISHDPFTVTNLSAGDFDKMLAGTGLAGSGYAFVELEETYGVNGIFAIGVAMCESGGSEPLPGNNYFGLIGMQFADAHEGILFFGRLMSSNVYAGKSIADIGKVYCPANWQNWADKVVQHMDTRINML